MTVQLIFYRGRIAAVCGPTRAYLSPEVDELAEDDPVLRVVLGMCWYAHLIAEGELDGPYRDADALAFVRGALVPDELLERPAIDLHATANWLRIPVEELAAARAAHQRQGARHKRPSRPAVRRRPS
jgi:hypothetical protein